MYGKTLIRLNPGARAQGQALAQIIGRFNMKQTTVLVEHTRLADGFLDGVRDVVGNRSRQHFGILPISHDVG